jgi:hypothetical protein
MPDEPTTEGHHLVLTGLGAANVNTDDGGTVFVRRDQPLPSNLKKGEEKRLRALGAFDPFPPKRLPPGTVERAPAAEAPEIPEQNPARVAAILNPTPEAVPAGSAETVLGWVGTDPDRAGRALQAEQAADPPRSTLVAKLEKLARGEQA